MSLYSNPLDLPSQRHRLKAVIADTGGWGVLLYLERPGDMATLVPIVPRLRDYEIVSAKEGNYDIWQASPQRIVRSDLTLAQVSEWLRASTPDDAELEANVAKWTEETLDLLGVPKRAAA